ncbi:MAG TPA: COX15/CtaA family protein [Candidatus Saccharimonadales bacterium]|nr:COX15/CtaA family protein [Candidatus Saccharimonadales bacterium]
MTSKDAALSVPDWPTSFGTWFPTLAMLDGGAFFEHSHRVIAAILCLLIVIQTILVWTKDERRWFRFFCFVTIGGVLVQAVLGGETVRQLLQYWLPVMHACFAEIVFAALICIAFFTSNWWISDRPQLDDHGSPSIRALALLNAACIFFQVILGAGFRHKEIPVWPHIAGAFVVLGTVTWLAVALKRQYGNSRELSKVRALLHAIFGIQFLLGLGAYWSRLQTVDAPQPMPMMVTLTVIHTVVGALLFGLSVAIVVMCYRLVSRGREAVSTSARQVAVR